MLCSWDRDLQVCVTPLRKGGFKEQFSLELRAASVSQGLVWQLSDFIQGPGGDVLVWEKEQG